VAPLNEPMIGTLRPGTFVVTVIGWKLLPVASAETMHSKGPAPSWLTWWIVIAGRAFSESKEWSAHDSLTEPSAATEGSCPPPAAMAAAKDEATCARNQTRSRDWRQQRTLTWPPMAVLPQPVSWRRTEVSC
jgi:hypothetical protein